MKKAETPQVVSPCEGCLRLCNYTQCRVYRLWLNRCWNRYRRWPEQLTKPPKPKKENVWRYDSPVLLRDFMEKEPCGRCPRQSYCADTESCPAYDAWLRLRWQRLRRQLTGGNT